MINHFSVLKKDIALKSWTCKESSLKMLNTSSATLASNDKPLELCEKTKEFFTEQLLQKDIAGNREIIHYEGSDTIHRRYKRYLRGKYGNMSSRRESLFKEALELKNAQIHVLQFFWAMYNMGLKGTITTHEFASSFVSESHGIRCGERTYRNAVNVLVQNRWLSKTYVPTGTRQASGTDKNGNATVSMLKVCRLVPTPKAFALFIGFKTAPKKLNNSNVTHISLPRKKVPSAIHEATPHPSPFSRGKDESDKSTIINKQSDNIPGTISQVESKEGLTKPSKPTALPTVEHSSIKTSPSACNHKNHSFKKGKKYGRKFRNKAQKTWHSNRILFLEDLLKIGKNQQIYEIAKLQTHLNYPSLAPSAGNFDIHIYCWHEYDSRKKKNLILREIYPDFKAFASSLEAPNPADLHKGVGEERNDIAIAKKRRFDDMRDIFSGLSDGFLRDYARKNEGDIPGFVLEKIQNNSMLLNKMPWLLTIGNIDIDSFKDEELKIFRDLADLLGIDD
jgi:hypothetical protein